MITIHTFTSLMKNGNSQELRRKDWKNWSFLVEGEWSESPYHQGYNRFAIGNTADRKFYAIKHIDFPEKIVAVAEVDGDEKFEVIAGQMMKKVREAGGPYVGMPDMFGNFDDDLFWATYQS